MDGDVEYLRHRALLEQALVQLRDTIDLLDRAQAPAQIAASLDFAMHQLLDAMSAPHGPAVHPTGG